MDVNLKYHKSPLNYTLVTLCNLTILIYSNIIKVPVITVILMYITVNIFFF